MVSKCTAASPRVHLHGSKDYVEDPRSYKRGGYHPICLYDELDKGRYQVLHKLGYGGSSTVWLCQEQTFAYAHSSFHYVAIKIVKAELSGASNRDVIFARKIQDAPEMIGKEHICLPLRSFSLDGPNGTHLCIVYPLLGPDIKVALEILFNEEEAEASRAIRHCSRQLMEGLNFLHVSGIVHGDFRPGNLLLGLHSLDRVPPDKLPDIFGSPQKVNLTLSSPGGSAPGSIPPYLVEAADFEDSVAEYLELHVYVTDFGQSVETGNHDQGYRAQLRCGIPRPYCAPEIFFDDRCMAESDIWSLACSIFEIRLGSKLIWPSEILGRDDNEYVFRLCAVLGKLPERWWSLWQARDQYFEAPEQQVSHSKLIARPGTLNAEWPTQITVPASIYDRVNQSSSIQTERTSEAISSTNEMDILADLLWTMLKYDPEHRPTAQHVLKHPWLAPCS